MCVCLCSSVDVCIYACACACMCASVCVQVYLDLCMHVRTSVYLCVYTCVYMRASVHYVSMCVRVCVCQHCVGPGQGKKEKDFRRVVMVMNRHLFCSREKVRGL